MTSGTLHQRGRPPFPLHRACAPHGQRGRSHSRSYAKVPKRHRRHSSPKEGQGHFPAKGPEATNPHRVQAWVEEQVPHRETGCGPDCRAAGVPVLALVERTRQSEALEQDMGRARPETRQAIAVSAVEE